MGKLISDKFAAWQEECEQRFQQLKANEEELNRIFIDIYGLQDELTPEVEDKDVTVRRADLTREIKSLLSYAVGCLFGRYSLDVDGLVYAGGEWDDSKYVTLKPVTDNVLPLCDEEYFGENDLVNRIVEFVRVVYGADTLEENLAFIAKALGNKGNTSREIIRNYFLKDFFADHCKIYQKRPIYWMFDSGQEKRLQGAGLPPPLGCRYHRPRLQQLSQPPAAHLRTADRAGEQCHFQQQRCPHGVHGAEASGQAEAPAGGVREVREKYRPPCRPAHHAGSG